MLKKLFSTLFLMSLLAYSFAQDHKAEITLAFEDYFKTVETKDYAATVDYIYPGLFEKVPKDKMLEAMERTKADTSTIVTMSNPELKKISRALTIDEATYALINYSFTMTMIITIESTDEEDDFDPLELSFEMLKANYGSNNVAYDTTNNTFVIDAHNAMYAILDPSYQGWKFLERKEKLKPLLKEILPKKVLKKLK